VLNNVRGRRISPAVAKPFARFHALYYTCWVGEVTVGASVFRKLDFTKPFVVVVVVPYLHNKRLNTKPQTHTQENQHTS
jgi:hypothetical protein